MSACAALTPMTRPNGVTPISHGTLARPPATSSPPCALIMSDPFRPPHRSNPPWLDREADAWRRSGHTVENWWSVEKLVERGEPADRREGAGREERAGRGERAGREEAVGRGKRVGRP